MWAASTRRSVQDMQKCATPLVVWPTLQRKSESRQTKALIPWQTRCLVFSTSIADTRFNNAIQTRTCQRRAAAYCCCVDTVIAHRETAGDCAARCLRKLAGHKFRVCRNGVPSCCCVQYNCVCCCHMAPAKLCTPARNPLS
jgi:hypothetical protein